jgi:hypothetical protein
MAIPDTTGGWGLDTVRLELGLAPTTNLSTAISLSNASYRSGWWDWYYSAEGNRFNLLMFRDYGSHHATVFYISPTAVTLRYSANNVATITSDQSWNLVEQNWGTGPNGWFGITPGSGGIGNTNISVQIYTTAMASYVGEAFFENTITLDYITFQVTYSYWAS